MIYETVPELIDAVIAYAETNKAYRFSKEVTFEGVAETSQANITARELAHEALAAVVDDLFQMVDDLIDHRSTAAVSAELDRPER